MTISLPSRWFLDVAERIITPSTHLSFCPTSQHITHQSLPRTNLLFWWYHFCYNLLTVTCSTRNPLTWAEMHNLQNDRPFSLLLVACAVNGSGPDKRPRVFSMDECTVPGAFFSPEASEMLSGLQSLSLSIPPCFLLLLVVQQIKCGSLQSMSLKKCWGLILECLQQFQCLALGVLNPVVPLRWILVNMKWLQLLLLQDRLWKNSAWWCSRANGVITHLLSCYLLLRPVSPTSFFFFFGLETVSGVETKWWHGGFCMWCSGQLPTWSSGEGTGNCFSCICEVGRKFFFLRISFPPLQPSHMHVKSIFPPPLLYCVKSFWPCSLCLKKSCFLSKCQDLPEGWVMCHCKNFHWNL